MFKSTRDVVVFFVSWPFVKLWRVVRRIARGPYIK